MMTKDPMFQGEREGHELWFKNSCFFSQKELAFSSNIILQKFLGLLNPLFGSNVKKRLYIPRRGSCLVTQRKSKGKGLMCPHVQVRARLTSFFFFTLLVF
jgi:hypothetical protein